MIIPKHQLPAVGTDHIHDCKDLIDHDGGSQIKSMTFNGFQDFPFPLISAYIQLFLFYDIY